MKRIRWKPLVLFFLFVVMYLSVAHAQEMLKDKVPVAQGTCLWAEKNFIFVDGNYVAVKSAFLALPCILFVKDNKLNPVWLVLYDKHGEYTEVIEWIDPDIFRSVWRKAI